MTDRIMGFLDKYDILISCQYGFRPGMSTEAAAIDLVQFVQNEQNSGKTVSAIFFDLSRAFDTIDSGRLSLKLQALGIRGPINSWIISYMRNRKILVRVRDTYSDEQVVDIGTPQGGVLGPLLFLLYVNDLPDFLEDGRPFMYADDTTVVVSGDSPGETWQKVCRVLDRFSCWCDLNGLVLNRDKTVIMEFKTSGNLPLIRHDDNHNQVTIVNSCKFLGSIVDDLMNWKEEVERIVKKLNSAYYAMFTLKNNLDTDSLIKYYYGCVQSVISYNIIIWGQSTEASRVFISQKRFIRLIFNLSRMETCRHSFKQYSIMTTPCLYLYRLLSHIHARRGEFRRRGDVHGYPTRATSDICLPALTRLSFKKTPLYAGIQLYNRLPTEYKGVEVRGFKNKLKKLLTEKAFYSVGEFSEYFRTSAVCLPPGCP